MDSYSKGELLAAQKAISSSVAKIEKVLETLLKRQPPPKAQVTLASRNVVAFRLALGLISRELISNSTADAHNR